MQLKRGNQNYSVSMMQPVRLGGEPAGNHSLISQMGGGAGNSDYALRHEPGTTKNSQTTGSHFNSKLSKVLNGGGPSGEFDYAQAKLYNAVKVHQVEQSRQIVND